MSSAFSSDENTNADLMICSAYGLACRPTRIRSDAIPWAGDAVLF